MVSLIAQTDQLAQFACQETSYNVTVSLLGLFDIVPPGFSSGHLNKNFELDRAYDLVEISSTFQGGIFLTAQLAPSPFWKRYKPDRFLAYGDAT